MEYKQNPVLAFCLIKFEVFPQCNLQSNPHSRVVDIKITPVQNGIEFENPRVPTESRAQIVQLNEKKKQKNKKQTKRNKKTKKT
jgi:hypothetical protein